MWLLIPIPMERRDGDVCYHCELTAVDVANLSIAVGRGQPIAIPCRCSIRISPQREIDEMPGRGLQVLSPARHLVPFAMKTALAAIPLSPGSAGFEEALAYCRIRSIGSATLGDRAMIQMIARLSVESGKGSGRSTSTNNTIR